MMSFLVSLRVILDHIEGINLGIGWSKMGIDFTFMPRYNLGTNKLKILSKFV